MYVVQQMGIDNESVWVMSATNYNDSIEAGVFAGAYQDANYNWHFDVRMFPYFTTSFGVNFYPNLGHPLPYHTNIWMSASGYYVGYPNTDASARVGGNYMDVKKYAITGSNGGWDFEQGEVYLASEDMDSGSAVFWGAAWENAYDQEWYPWGWNNECWDSGGNYWSSWDGNTRWYQGGPGVCGINKYQNGLGVCPQQQ